MPGKITLTLAKSVLAAALCAATINSAQAQSLGDLLGGVLQDSVRSSQMKKVCLDQQIAIEYAGYMMGYHTFDTGGGERISIEKRNALAQEIVGRATITDWSFQGWSGGRSNGQCNMHFAMTLAPEDAVHFNNDPLWGGGVGVGLTNDNGQWKVASFEDTGARNAVSGWLRAYMQQRERAPGGAPRLKPPLSPQQLDLVVRSAQGCESHWQVSDDLFPAYNAWLDGLGDSRFSIFKTSTGAQIENGRLVRSTDSEIVCRYDITTGEMFGNGRVATIRDIDMRFTVMGGRPKWEVASYPNAAISAFSASQIAQLEGRAYVNDRPLREWTAAQDAARQEEARRRAYANSPAGRAEAAKQSAQEAARNRVLSAEYRRRGLACQNSGGTWGAKLDMTTVIEVEPGAVPPDTLRMSLGCYRL